jgi:hypothetical protein
MKLVWKFPLLRKQENTVYLPQGSKMLTVLPRGEFATLYAVVNKQKPKVPHTIVTVGTGLSCPSHMTFNAHIASFERFGHVYHAFSLGENIDTQEPQSSPNKHSEQWEDLADDIYKAFTRTCK